MRSRSTIVLLSALFVLTVGVARASAPIETVVAFNPAAGQFPEGVAVDVTGTAYVSLISPVAQIRTIDRSGGQSVLAQFPPVGFGPLGLAVSSAGDLYVAVASFDPATRGVYRVAPDGTTARLPGTGGILFPNGLTLDPRGDLYATDSIAGAIWKIPRGGSAAIWFQSALLAGDGSVGLGFPLGANGIAYGKNEVVVTNTEGAKLVRVPVLPDGTAGPASVVAQGAALAGADGVALDVFGDAFVAVNPQNTLIRVAPDGAITTLGTAADGLDNPASVAFATSHGERKTLYITNFAVFSAAPKPALLRTGVGVPGMPLR
jgi:DNA-binding beta-propeller fold protein YncE